MAKFISSNPFDVLKFPYYSSKSVPTLKEIEEYYSQLERYFELPDYGGPERNEKWNSIQIAVEKLRNATSSQRDSWYRAADLEDVNQVIDLIKGMNETELRGFVDDNSPFFSRSETATLEALKLAGESKIITVDRIFTFGHQSDATAVAAIQNIGDWELVCFFRDHGSFLSTSEAATLAALTSRDKLTSPITIFQNGCQSDATVRVAMERMNERDLRIFFERNFGDKNGFFSTSEKATLEALRFANTLQTEVPLSSPLLRNTEDSPSEDNDLSNQELSETAKGLITWASFIFEGGYQSPFTAIAAMQQMNDIQLKTFFENNTGFLSTSEEATLAALELVSARGKGESLNVAAEQNNFMQTTGAVIRIIMDFANHFRMNNARDSTSASDNLVEKKPSLDKTTLLNTIFLCGAKTTEVQNAFMQQFPTEFAQFQLSRSYG